MEPGGGTQRPVSMTDAAVQRVAAMCDAAVQWLLRRRVGMTAWGPRCCVPGGCGHRSVVGRSGRRRGIAVKGLAALSIAASELGVGARWAGFAGGVVDCR